MFSILLAYDFCRIRLWLACACHMLRIHGTWEGHRKRLTFYRGQRSGLDGELVACWKLREKKTMGKPFSFSWLINGLSWFIRALIMAYHGLSGLILVYHCEILWVKYIVRYYEWGYAPVSVTPMCFLLVQSLCPVRKSQCTVWLIWLLAYEPHLIISS